MKIAVAGAGIVGLSAARFLSARGHDVTIFERYSLFSDRGSSHGRSRIVRRAYPDPFYTDCMTKAYPMWGELEAESGESILHELGLLYFGAESDPKVSGVAHTLAAAGVPHKILNPKEAGQVLPGLRLEIGEIGIFTPEAGWVEADTALRATHDLALANGVVVREGLAMDRESLEDNFDAFVVAAGGWVREFVDVPVQVTEQTFGYAPAPIDGPAWIDGSELTYGIPSDGLGHKIGLHVSGPKIDPNHPRRDPSKEAMRVIAETARRRFGVHEPLQNWKACLYTSTPNEDFILGRLGSKGFFASACSGHGFKMGPWIGTLLADFIDGTDAPESYPRFALKGKTGA